MIDEHVFSERYTSFWKQCLPMGEQVTLAIGRHLLESFADARPALKDDARPELISDMALRWFGACIQGRRLARSRPGAKAIARIKEEVTASVNRWAGFPEPPLPPPSRAELTEAVALSRQLAFFLRHYESSRPLVAHPSFAGCGLLAPCRGDLLVGDTLYEVKAVDRGFRSPDVRQLVIYCALNSVHQGHDIREVGLINPRRGTFFRSELEWLVQNLSGQGSAGLFQEVVDFLSTERVSA